MSTTIPINVNVPQGFNVSLLVTHLTEYARQYVAKAERTRGRAENTVEPIITEKDLVIDPVVEAMFSSVPPLSPEIDVQQEYGDYLNEKYK